jgi:hypothetical protein
LSDAGKSGKGRGECSSAGGQHCDDLMEKERAAPLIEPRRLLRYVSSSSRQAEPVRN